MIARSLLTQSDATDVRIFYSYARRDQSWREEIDRLLPQFDWDVGVRTWYDGEIEPGAEWGPEIDRNLQAADVVLLFVGQAFVDSRYCREVELPAALRRHADGQARVVPIIIEETDPDWRKLDFGRLQVLPRNGVPVSAWNDRRRALESVVQGLVDLIVRQGLHHDPRMRWELHLLANDHEFTHAHRRAVTTELRRFTSDDTLRCIDVGPGSVVLTIESTQDAFARVCRAFDDKDLRAFAGWGISQLLRLFGAGVRAASTTAVFHRPDPLPPWDRMLLPSGKLQPAVTAGIAFNDDNPLELDFIITRGDSQAQGAAFEAETLKLLDYFNTCLAVREDDQYVNLSPHEDAKLLPDSLAGTRLGATLLECDYRLKRLAASLLHPDLESGRTFWAEVLRRVEAKGISGRVPLAAFQRVWIVPNKAVVYEGDRAARGATAPTEHARKPRCAIVAEQYMKALTERQYLSGRSQDEPTDGVAAVCDEVFRECVLPIVEEEVNNGESFAELRQFYHSTILAHWFKGKYRTHPKVAKYIDSGRPSELGVKVTSWGFGDVTRTEPPKACSSGRQSDPLALVASTPNVDRIRSSSSYQVPENREYFERYLQVFESGVFYVEREEPIEGTGLKMPRAYLAGAIDMRALRALLQRRVARGSVVPRAVPEHPTSANPK